MNWDAIGAIAELLGAIAVLATLLYLAIQIRQSSSSIHNQTSWAITQALDSLNTQITEHGEVTDIWIRGREDPDSLSQEEFERFRSFTLSWLNLAVYIHNHPTKEHEFYIPYVATLTQSSPGIRQIVDEIEFSLPSGLYDSLIGKNG